MRYLKTLATVIALVASPGIAQTPPIGPGSGGLGGGGGGGGATYTNGTGLTLTGTTFSLGDPSNSLIFGAGAANTYGLALSGSSVTGSSTHGIGYSMTGTMNTSGVVDGAAFFANITDTASGAGSTLLDLQVGHVSQFSVDKSGNIAGPGVLQINNMTQTWTSGATTYTAVKMNVTNTASAAGSLLMDLQIGGVSQLKVNKTGYVISSAGPTGGLVLEGAGDPLHYVEAIGGAVFGWNSSNIEWSIERGGVPGFAGISTAIFAWSNNTSSSPAANAFDVAMLRQGTGTVAINTYSAGNANGAFSLSGAVQTLAIGELGLPKITASGSAPGAGGGKLALVCGTNAGTAKLITYAGTSTTPATILDNIGSGVSGC